MDNWEEYLNTFVPSEKLRHEEAAIRALWMAITASQLGTYGVGAVLLDEEGEVLIEGHNEVYVGDFRSDLHAEMVVVNRFEEGPWSRDVARRCTLITSLEPCPMCMTRLIFAGIGTVLHLSDDSIGGMVQRRSALPPIFREITEDQNQVWGRAECSEDLRRAAFHIWDQSRDELDRRLPSRGNRASEE